MFAATQMMGTGMAFPDVCLTPAPPAPSPIPIPYPNIAMLPMGVGFVATVLFMCAPAHNQGTSVPQSNGDNAGVAMGVASGTVMGPMRYTLCANTCLIHGMPAARLTSMTIQNSTNIPGAVIVPSQPLVMILMP